MNKTDRIKIAKIINKNMGNIENFTNPEIAINSRKNMGIMCNLVSEIIKYIKSEPNFDKKEFVLKKCG